MNFTRAGVLAVAWLAGGCALESPASRGAEAGPVPAAWSASREAKAGVDHRWVRKIGGAPLASLVAEAVAANPDLRASAARVDQAAALAKIAGADRLPGLGAGGQAGRQKQNFIGFPGGGGSATNNNFGVSLEAAWELDVWGKLKAGAEAAIADAQAQRQLYQGARVSLAAQVSKSWLAVAEANEQLALAERAVKSREEAEDAVRSRFESALEAEGGSAAQVRLSQSDLAASRAALEARRGDREQALRQLELLLGRYPAARIREVAELPAMPPAPPVGLPSELLLRRPDILAAERQLAAAGRRLDEADKARFPALSLTGGLGTATDQLGDLLSSDFGVWSLGGSLTQPIFQGGRIEGGIERAAAVDRESVANLQRVVLDAFGEVEQALSSELYLARRETETGAAAALAKEAAERAAEEFRAGTGDVLTYLAAQQREIDTAAQVIALRRLRLANRVDLHLALGGDFSI
jgi:NodT family efflux transporter outer membrane factor (OMF) lipoprotein